MAINRRTVLLGGAAATAAIVAGAGGVLATWWQQPTAAGYRVLSETEAAFLRAMAGALFPPGDVIALDGETAGLDHFVDELFAPAPELPRSALRVLLHALDAWPLSGAHGFFTGLDRAKRQEILLGWAEHPSNDIRSAYTSLVAFLGMGYTTHPDVAPMIAGWYGCGYGR